MLGSLLVRGPALVASFVLVGGATPPAPAPAAKAAIGGGSEINHRALSFRGAPLVAPLGVEVLSDTSLRIGREIVEFPADVVVVFNEKGEAVFTLAKGARPRSWILKVGRQKVIASATARAVVPLLAVGEPRIEWSPYQFLVPAPRDHLQQAADLKDPFDASPYR